MKCPSKNTGLTRTLKHVFSGKTALLLVAFLCTFFASAQSDARIDSLIMRLSVLEQSIEKADILFEISNEYRGIDNARAKEYGKLSLNLSTNLNYPKGELSATLIIGKVYLYGDFNVAKSKEYFRRALQIAKVLGDTNKELESLKGLGFASVYSDEYANGLTYYGLALTLAEKENNFNEVTNVSSYIGDLYFSKGDTLKGVEYYEKIYKIHNGNNFENADYTIMLSLSQMFMYKKDFVLAKEFALDGLVLAEIDNDFPWISYINAFLANIELTLNNPKSAIEYAKHGLEIAEKGNLNKERLDNYQQLAEAYEAINDYKSSSVYLKKEFELRDSLLEEEKRIQRIKFENEVISSEQVRENEKNKSELVQRKLESENDQLLIRASAIVLSVTFIFLFLLYRRLRKGSKLVKQLESQQEQLQKLSIVAANIEQMVMIVGKDDRIEWVNESFEKKFGFLRFEAVKRTPYELLGGPRTSLEEVNDINGQIFKDKIAIETSLVQYAKDNTPYLTRLHISPILNEDKELIRYVVISHDITEEQKIAEELKELSLVASKTTNSIVVINAELQIVWVNDSFTKLTGLSREVVQGKKRGDLYNGPLFNNDENKRVDALFASLQAFTIEQQSVNRLTNTSYWISMNVTPVFNDKGELDKYISVATEITEIKKLESQYSSLVERSTDMIYEINIEGHFTFTNDVMTKLLGYTKEELIGMHFTELIVPAQRESVAGFYGKQAFEKINVTDLEFEVLTKKKSAIWVGQKARLNFDENGKEIIGFSAVTRDISEKKKLDLAIEKSFENTKLLSEIGMQITSTLSIVDLIGQVYENLNKIMDANVFGIAIPNKEKTKLVFPKIIEKGEHLENYSFDLNDNSRLGVISFKENREIVTGNYEEDIRKYVTDTDEIRKAVAGEEPISLIYIPLKLRGETLGVLTVQSFRTDAYDEYQLNLVRSLGTFVAIALENATLYETMEEKIEQRTKEVKDQKGELESNYFKTRLLSEIGKLVSSTLDLGKIIDELYAGVGQLLDAETFGIFTYDEETGIINYDHTIEREERFKPFSAHIDDNNGYAAWCIKNRKEVLINDNTIEYKKYDVEPWVIEGETPLSILFYPLIVDNKVLGVITVQSTRKNAYEEYHFDILKTLAAYIGTVVDNGRLYDSLESKVKQRTLELEQKNYDITASINYAKRLQKGILPAESFLKQLLPESFVLFKPKDIVSGDFYWVDRRKSKILFAVVDCTGHGVPGAMMSIIGRNLLEQAVNEKGITIPSQILNFLQAGLSLAFGQTGERKAELFDGMDLALCSIDLNTNILEFSGANNSLYLFQDDELIVLKGDKVGISAEYEVSGAYSNIEIEIKKGDCIYLTSDGFPDQFGGERYKKFTYKRMNELLKANYTKPMPEQYEIIKTTIDDWKGDREQTDDICMLGVRI